jgi:hypothetical protein
MRTIMIQLRYALLLIKDTMNISPDGYYRIKIKGKSYKAHRLIIEEKLGRRLLSTEHIHHINGNKLDNDSKNLLIVSHSEHRKLHRKNFTIGGKKKCTKCNKLLSVKQNFPFNKREKRWGRWCKICISRYDKKRRLKNNTT